MNIKVSLLNVLRCVFLGIPGQLELLAHEHRLPRSEQTLQAIRRDFVGHSSSSSSSCPRPLPSPHSFHHSFPTSLNFFVNGVVVSFATIVFQTISSTLLTLAFFFSSHAVRNEHATPRLDEVEELDRRKLKGVRFQCKCLPELNKILCW